MIKVTFIAADGTQVEAEGEEGTSLLEAGQAANMPLEGTCEGQMACSTCHVIIGRDWVAKLPPASDDEEDMLDLAFGLTHTSRLGCQIMMNDSLDGLKVKLPAATRNMMVDKK